MKTNGKDGEFLSAFINEWVIPKFLCSDIAKEEYDGEWVGVRKHFVIPQNII